MAVRTQTRISKGVLDKASQIASACHIEDPRVILEAVFNAYADKWVESLSELSIQPDPDTNQDHP